MEVETLEFGTSTDPEVWDITEALRLNGRPWKEDCPAAKARNETSLWSGILEAVKRIPRQQTRGGQDAVPEGFRCPNRRSFSTILFISTCISGLSDARPCGP